MRNRFEIIQELIDKHSYNSYLEIGMWYGETINRIKCEKMVGVDPEVLSSISDDVTTYEMTSDAYFTNNSDDMFDIIFIDGLHHAEQVYKDVKNSLGILNTGGTIVCHDMNPPMEINQRVPQETGEWTGDCWKAWVKLRQEESDLYMCVVDTDWGCGIIQQGKQDILDICEEITYHNFNINRREWLNLIPDEEWKP